MLLIMIRYTNIWFDCLLVNNNSLYKDYFEGTAVAGTAKFSKLQDSWEGMELFKALISHRDPHSIQIIKMTICCYVYQ